MKNGLLSVAGLMMLPLATSACVRDAQIAVPATLAASTEQIVLAGMGGSDRGSFRLGASEGHFTRAADRYGDDFATFNSGGGTFSVTGPETGAISAECAFDQSDAEIGIATLPVERFLYRCRFQEGGRPIDASLVLEEAPRSPRRLLSQVSRAGTLHFGGRIYGIRAIHEFQGGSLLSGTPLGYSFDTDGRAIGAVDLNGLDKTIYTPRGGAERQAVLIGSLALSILWDPGD